MNCNDLVELITDYLEGALPFPERARFEAHLAECRGCATYLEQIRTTVRAAGKLNSDSIPSAAMEQLLRVFSDWAKTP